MGHSNCDRCGHDTKMCDCDKQSNFVKQVGGDHYEGKYQHWDWCDDCRVPYLESAATKYIQRWRDKNGVEDLEKAISYLKKAEGNPRHLPAGCSAYRDDSLMERYLTSSNVGEAEAAIIRHIGTWNGEPLTGVYAMIQELIDDLPL